METYYMSENDSNGWNEHSKLVLSELQRLNQRLDDMEIQFDKKFNKITDMFRSEHKELEKIVNEQRIQIAVIAHDVALKSAGIAFMISGIIAIVAKLMS